MRKSARTMTNADWNRRIATAHRAAAAMQAEPFKHSDLRPAQRVLASLLRERDEIVAAGQAATDESERRRLRHRYHINAAALAKSRRINAAQARSERPSYAMRIAALRTYRAPRFHEIHPWVEWLLADADAEYDEAVEHELAEANVEAPDADGNWVAILDEDVDHQLLVTLRTRIGEVQQMLEDLAFGGAMTPDMEASDRLATLEALDERDAHREHFGEDSDDDRYAMLGEVDARYEAWAHDRAFGKRTGLYSTISVEDRRNGPIDLLVEDYTTADTDPVMVASQRPTGWNVLDAERRPVQRRVLDRHALDALQPVRDRLRDLDLLLGRPVGGEKPLPPRVAAELPRAFA